MQISRSSCCLRTHKAFTLIELLVTVALLGALVAMLVPALNGVREAARRTHCTNHLHQLALACLLHESDRQHLPAGGWSHEWSPDPDCGFGRKQPGTWTFNILPYLEESSLRDAGRDGRSNTITDQQRKAAAQRTATAVAVFQCPSRRSAESYPANIQQFNCLPIQRAARSDYAMCAGDRFLVADVPKTALTKPWRAARDTGGVLFQASAVKLHKIVDGAAHTYLMGEKFVEPQFYRDLSVGELSGMWSYDWGVVRVASEDQAPWRDRNIGANGGAALGAFRFGSPHYGGWNMAFVDGTVRHIPFDLDPAVHARLGRRNDG